MQSFKVKETPMQIENGIYLGDFSVIKFFGTFEFDLIKSKVCVNDNHEAYMQ
jgi:hypothetical protein